MSLTRKLLIESGICDQFHENARERGGAGTWNPVSFTKLFRQRTCTISSLRPRLSTVSIIPDANQRGGGKSETTEGKGEMSKTEQKHSRWTTTIDTSISLSTSHGKSTFCLAVICACEVRTLLCRLYGHSYPQARPSTRTTQSTRLARPNVSHTQAL